MEIPPEEIARGLKPRNWAWFQVTFYVAEGGEASAAALANDLKALGWNDETIDMTDVEGVESIVVRGHRKLGQGEAPDSLFEFDDQMERLAERHGAEYDGSGATLAQDDE